MAKFDNMFAAPSGPDYIAKILKEELAK